MKKKNKKEGKDDEIKDSITRGAMKAEKRESNSNKTKERGIRTQQTKKNREKTNKNSSSSTTRKEKQQKEKRHNTTKEGNRRTHTLSLSPVVANRIKESKIQ